LFQTAAVKIMMHAIHMTVALHITFACILYKVNGKFYPETDHNGP